MLCKSNHCINNHFTIQSGTLHYFFIEDWQYVNEFRHVVGEYVGTHNAGNFLGKVL